MKLATTVIKVGVGAICFVTECFAIYAIGKTVENGVKKVAKKINSKKGKACA